MQIMMVRVYGIIVAALAVIGLLAGEGRALGIMNVDIFMDVLRVLIAAALLCAGFVADSDGFARLSLRVVGGIFLVLGIVGMIDPPLWGLTPGGLTVFDGAASIVAGLLAIAVASRKETQHGSVIDE